MDDFVGILICCLAFGVLLFMTTALTEIDSHDLDTDLLDECRSVSYDLCDSKDMTFNKQYLDEDGYVMVECGTWYELVSYKVNCKAD